MQIQNIAGYKFVPLTDLETYQSLLHAKCTDLSIKGTILLSEEGININVAGQPESIRQLQAYLSTLPVFAQMTFHETYSDAIPFNLMKVKIKQEIITFRQNHIDVTKQRAPSISPQQLKEWLDTAKDFTLLDTRNAYEVKFGTFEKAIHLNIADFGELPDAIHPLDKKKPVVMFCTGGIRCEKAALHMQDAGFEEVYQLDTGILGYFAHVGGEHYDGECFVFDERVAVDSTLKPTGTMQCVQCMGPIAAGSNCQECY